ncbi:MAG TPA: hypothetical protein VEB21_01655 [Terriglobales bacterium]|nr:hypothetical protein [Terriglobales bacterium]
MRYHRMGNVLRVVVAAAVCLLGARYSEAQLYGADGSGGNASNLYILDPASGSIISTVGPIGFAVTGLAFDPTTGTLYGSTSRNELAGLAPSLITINTATGAGTLVGPINLGGQGAADIAFLADGTLLGWIEPSNDDLATINKATGQATIIGEAFEGTSEAGLSVNPADEVFFGGDASVQGLLQINPATGAVIDSIPFSPSLDVGLGMAFDANGQLIAIFQINSDDRALARVHPTTGQVVIVGATVDDLDALALAPGTLLPAIDFAAESAPAPAMSFVALAAMVLALLGVGARFTR